MPLPQMKEPTGFVTRSLAFTRGVSVAVPMFLLLLAINVLQVILSPMMLLAPKTFRAMNRWGANGYWSLCILLYEGLYDVDIQITGDDIPMRENAIVILNHQQMADIPVLFKLGKLKGRLGDMKWFVKKSLKYVPGMGWGMQFLDNLFISRNWTADEGRIRDVFARILDNNVAAWVVSFLEGTRMKPWKLERSQAYARERGLPVLNHVLFPRTKGFVSTVKGLGKHVDAVYDVTIGYVDAVPSLWQLFKGYVKRVNMHVRRFEIDSLPEGETALTQWVIDCYVAKDSLLERYYSTGSFEAETSA